MQFQNARKGFSLIEVVVYIAVLAGISTIAVGSLLRVNAALAQVRAIRSLNGAGTSALERLIRVTRDAKSVNEGSSTFDVSPGALSLTGSESPAVTYGFSVSGGGLLLDTGATQTVLTPPNVAVTNLVFRSITNGTVSRAVKIELSLAVSSHRATTTQNYYSTVILRNSYAQ